MTASSEGTEKEESDRTSRYVVAMRGSTRSDEMSAGIGVTMSCSTSRQQTSREVGLAKAGPLSVPIC